MFTRIIAIVTLIILLNSIMGCAKFVNMSIEELKNNPGIKLSAVRLPTFIEGITLPSGEEIRFKETTGRFDKKAGMIAGVAQDGTAIEKSLTDIELVLLKRNTADGSQIVVMDAKTFTLKAEKQPWKTINGLCVQDGETINFGTGFARYDSEKNIIKGSTDWWIPVEIKMEDMQLINVKQQPTVLDNIARITILTLVLGLVVCAVFYAVFSNVDLYDWD